MIALTVLAAGCTSLLPKEQDVSKASWSTFEDAHSAFDAVEVGTSTAEHLQELGFAPEVAPNVEILGYVEIINRMSPIFAGENLPQGFKQCLDAKEQCSAYVLNIKHIKRDRIGNVALDLLGFRKETKITGWQLGATFIMVKDVVVYKSWVGIPEVESYEKRIIPLGPLQNLGDLLKPY